MRSLEKARLAKSLSQMALGDLAGLTNVAISHMENGLSTPQNDTRKRLENILGEKIDWLSSSLDQPREKAQWHEVEKEFRQAILSVNDLALDVQHDFIEVVVRNYVKILEQKLHRKMNIKIKQEVER